MDEVSKAAVVYTIPEICRMFGINKNLAYELARTGQLPVLKLGRRVVCPKVAIDRLLSEASSSSVAAGND